MQDKRRKGMKQTILSASGQLGQQTILGQAK